MNFSLCAVNFTELLNLHFSSFFCRKRKRKRLLEKASLFPLSFCRPQGGKTGKRRLRGVLTAGGLPAVFLFFDFL